MEVWGSVGGDDNYPSVDAGTAGNGGYSYGNISLNAQKSLFVCVGGNSCYNGGGVGERNGGDATHIAYISGLLKEFKSNYTSVLLIVAGGGGGVNNYGTAGYGGGGNNSGGTGSAFSWNTISSQGGEGGTQTGGGKSIKFNPYNLSVISVNGDFGMGGYGYVVTTSNDYGGGGGAGFYGGGGTSFSGTGGGGSGYLSPLLTKSGGQNGTNSKLGKATITEVQ